MKWKYLFNATATETFSPASKMTSASGLNFTTRRILLGNTRFTTIPISIGSHLGVRRALPHAQSKQLLLQAPFYSRIHYNLRHRELPLSRSTFEVKERTSDNAVFHRLPETAKSRVVEDHHFPQYRRAAYKPFQLSKRREWIRYRSRSSTAQAVSWLGRGVLMSGLTVGVLSYDRYNVVHAALRQPTLPVEELPIRNLVFMGGGVKGLGYIGALLELKKQLGQEKWEMIERCGGASAGAITATLLAAGYTPEELEKLFTDRNFNFKAFFFDEKNKAIHEDLEFFFSLLSKNDLSHFLANEWRKLSKVGNDLRFDIGGVRKAFKQLGAFKERAAELSEKFDRISKVYTQQEGGFCSGEDFRDWIDERIARQVARLETGDEENYWQKYRNLTFGDLKKLIHQQKESGEFKGYRHLHIVTAIYHVGANQAEKKVFSSEHPHDAEDDVIIADAVRVSMSIPYIFKPWNIYCMQDGERKKDETLRGIDGGTVDNHPSALFDTFQYASSDLQGSHHYGPKTEFINPETIGFRLFNPDELVPMLKPTTAQEQRKPPKDDDVLHRNRDIDINAKGITLYHVELDEKQKGDLIESGGVAVRQQLYSKKRQVVADKCQEWRNTVEGDKRRLRNIFKEKRCHITCTRYAKNTFVCHDQVESKLPMIQRDWIQKETPQQWVIIGSPGTGKTTVVEFLMETYLETYMTHQWHQDELSMECQPIIWHCDANTLYQLKNDYLSLARRLGLFPNGQQDLSSAVRRWTEESDEAWEKRQLKYLKEALSRRLSNYPYWLVTYDTVLVSTELGAFLLQPTIGESQGDVVIAAYDSRYVQNTKTIKSRVINLNRGLNPEKARALLAKYCPELDDDPTLLLTFFKRPMALVQAANTIKKQNITSYQDYITQRFNPALEELRTIDDFRGFGDEELTLYATIKVSLNMLNESLQKGKTHLDSVYAQHTFPLLQMTSLLYQENIPRKLLTHYLAQAYPEKAAEDIEEYERQLLNFAKANNLLTVQGDTLSMHQTVQRVLRVVYPAKKAQFEVLLMGLNTSFNQMTEGKKQLYWAALPLVPHINGLLAQLETRNLAMGISQPILIASYKNLGSLYYEQGDFSKTAECHQKALKIQQEMFVEAHPDIATSYNNLGVSYHKQGDFNKAAEYYQKALKIRQETLGGTHPDTASSYNNLGMLYSEQGEYNKAEKYLQKALKIEQEVLERAHPHIATSYNNLGLIYYQQGDFNTALDYFQKALKIEQESLGEVHLNTAMSYSNLGTLYYQQGEYNKAEKYHQKALKIRQETVGEAHLDTAMSYNNFGLLYYEQGDYSTAVTYYQKALKIQREMLGEAHPNTASSYNNLGMLHYQQGEYNKAEKYHQKALKIRQESVGKRHPDTATSYNNLGMLHYQQGEYNKAEKYHQKALKIRQESVGERHPDTATSYNNLGMLHYQQGDYTTATTYYQKALKIQRKTLGEAHPNIASSYNNLGLLYLKQRNFDTAATYHQKALKITQETLGEAHPNTATSYNNLGSLYYEQGDLNTAAMYYQKALKIQRETLGEAHPNTATSYNNLGTIYFKRGNLRKAKKYLEKSYISFKKQYGEEHSKTQTVRTDLTECQQQLKQEQVEKMNSSLTKVGLFQERKERSYFNDDEESATSGMSPQQSQG